MDWNLAALIVTAVGGSISAAAVIAKGVHWTLERRKVATKVAVPDCLRDLSPAGLRLANLVLSRTVAAAEVDQRHPGGPMSTNEDSLARGAAWAQLSDRSLQSAVGIESALTFDALVCDLERRKLIDVLEHELFHGRRIYISPLGEAVLNRTPPPELQAAHA